jgi:ABC-type sugar transport system ATPase subunit
MADRIIVLFEGSVMREFERAEATEDAIMHAATGIVEEAVT